MCFGSKSQSDPTPPARKTEIKNPDMFRTPTFEPSSSNKDARRESRVSGHSPSESIDEDRRQANSHEVYEAPEEQRVGVGVEVSDGPGSGLEPVPVSVTRDDGGGARVGSAGAPEIQGLEGGAVVR